MVMNIIENDDVYEDIHKLFRLLAKYTSIKDMEVRISDESDYDHVSLIHARGQSGSSKIEFSTRSWPHCCGSFIVHGMSSYICKGDEFLRSIAADIIHLVSYHSERAQVIINTSRETPGLTALCEEAGYDKIFTYNNTKTSNVISTYGYQFPMDKTEYEDEITTDDAFELIPLSINKAYITNHPVYKQFLNKEESEPVVKQAVKPPAKRKAV